MSKSFHDHHRQDSEVSLQWSSAPSRKRLQNGSLGVESQRKAASLMLFGWEVENKCWSYDFSVTVIHALHTAVSFYWIPCPKPYIHFCVEINRQSFVNQVLNLFRRIGLTCFYLSWIWLSFPSLWVRFLSQFCHFIVQYSFLVAMLS